MAMTTEELSDYLINASDDTLLDYFPDFRGVVVSAYFNVYRQALRDVIAKLGPLGVDTWNFEEYPGHTVQDLVLGFAAERGIDLSEQE